MIWFQLSWSNLLLNFFTYVQMKNYFPFEYTWESSYLSEGFWWLWCLSILSWRTPRIFTSKRTRTPLESMVILWQGASNLTMINAIRWYQISSRRIWSWEIRETPCRKKAKWSREAWEKAILGTHESVSHWLSRRKSWWQWWEDWARNNRSLN